MHESGRCPPPNDWNLDPGLVLTEKTVLLPGDEGVIILSEVERVLFLSKVKEALHLFPVECLAEQDFLLLAEEASLSVPRRAHDL